MFDIALQGERGIWKMRGKGTGTEDLSVKEADREKKES